jgi:myb proto-oncogene protein
MPVKVEQDLALELPPNAEAVAGAGAGAEEFSPPLSSGEEEEEADDDDDDEEDETDSEGYDGAGNGGGAPQLKKGPWTPEEDKRLKDYVEAHGEGNWNKVQRNAGLNRCGKSCRLRWANHLRPDLKKGPFDEEEVDKIIKFHMMWGNKWAKMASHVSAVPLLFIRSSNIRLVHTRKDGNEMLERTWNDETFMVFSPNTACICHDNIHIQGYICQ